MDIFEAELLVVVEEYHIHVEPYLVLGVEKLHLA
jgi:hypothetical protein